MRRLAALLFVCLFAAYSFAQSTNASLTGFVFDSGKALIPGAKVIAINTATNARFETKTDKSGSYVLPSLPAGPYRMEIGKVGFKTILKENLDLHVQSALEVNFQMAVGSMSESITVTGSTADIQNNGTVSTVIGHELIENMPLNGKDLTTLFELSPGTLLNAGGLPNSGGGFSVDGQRPTANYLTIDGASGNSYVPVQGGTNLVGGASIATSASGGTNGILPIDAIEEYRMDTSTYTAENGRTPGGQIQVRTRSGTNKFHGTLFENFRNQVLDDKDWFVKYNNLKQAQLRMNDFGGTFGGPILKNRLFFFVAHDTLLLDQPNTITQQDVPDSSLSQTAYPAFKNFLAAFPVGNGGPDTANPGFNFYNASFPGLIRDHTTSVRVDAQLPRSAHAFFRANVAPSSSYQPSFAGSGASVNIYTYTGGLTIPISRTVLNDLTINRTSSTNHELTFISSGDGNDPNLFTNNLPTGVNISTSNFAFGICSVNFVCPTTTTGPTGLNGLTQWNVLDSISFQLARQVIKVGIDYLTRQTTINHSENSYAIFTQLDASGPATADLAAGNLVELDYAHENEQPVIEAKNISLYINDDIKVSHNLSLNGGVRWEYNPAPSASPLGVLALDGAFGSPASVQASLSTAPMYASRLNDVAPRFGFAWSPFQQDGHNTVVRGGVGIYFDTGQAASMAGANIIGYPYQYLEDLYAPLSYSAVNWTGLASTASAPTLPEAKVYLIDPKLVSPRTYEWSVTLEQTLGKTTKLSTSYVGNDGERLAGSYQYSNTKNSTTGQYPVNRNLVSANGVLYYLTNRSHSNYQALQEQLTMKLGARVTALGSYTWAHAEDNGSADFSAVGATAINPMANSAYDIRHMFAAAIHYAPAGIGRSHLSRAITSGWGLDSIVRLQTASPFTVTAGDTNPTAFLANADAVPGQPAVLHTRYLSSGKLVPGGVLLNHAAFAQPPTDSAGNPLRQGNSPTNGYRLFGLKQWDLAASRSWPIWRETTLNFRIDAYNLLNTPMFSSPPTLWTASNANTFGIATGTAATANGAVPSENGTTGQQLAVFQNGGPRSIQLSMKLKF